MSTAPREFVTGPQAVGAGVALLALAALSGCAELRVDFSETRERSFEPKDYERVLERWTREDRLYLLDGLDNALTVTATFKSWEYRRAFVDRYAHDFRLTPAERRALEDEQRIEMEAAHVFFVAATSTRLQWSDLAAETSPWCIRLVNDRDEVLTPFHDGHEPAGIEAIRRPTPFHRAYFPYLNVFRQVFVLRFPRVLPTGEPFLRAGIRSFVLDFAGAFGKAEMRWSSAD